MTLQSIKGVGFCALANEVGDRAFAVALECAIRGAAVAARVAAGDVAARATGQRREDGSSSPADFAFPARRERWASRSRRLLESDDRPEETEGGTMNGRVSPIRGWRVGLGVLLLAFWGLVARGVSGAPLNVAVTVPDIEAIVKEVGGEEVDTFSLLSGCILRRNLQVEDAVQPRLLKADAVVWTGFMPEALAVRLAVSNTNNSETRNSWCPLWINVSEGAVQVDRPASSMTSSCLGYVDMIISHGDPFFWLNPENGAVIARDVAQGLAKLRPAKATLFEARARAFRVTLERDIARWKQQLRPLSGLRVFCTQCGWQNFARLGGPKFVVCKQVRGCVLAPAKLVAYAQENKVNVVLVDTHTPQEIAKAFRDAAGWKVLELPSSIEGISGAHAYTDLFENMVQALQKGES